MKVLIILSALLFWCQITWAGCGDTEFFKTAGYYVMNLSSLEYLSSTSCGYVFKNTRFSSRDAINEVLAYTNKNKKKEAISYFNGPQFKQAVSAGNQSIDLFIETISKELDPKTSCGMQASELLKQNENAEKLWNASKRRCGN
jgi:hypothetical protein